MQYQEILSLVTGQYRVSRPVGLQEASQLVAVIYWRLIEMAVKCQADGRPILSSLSFFRTYSTPLIFKNINISTITTNWYFKFK